MRVLVSLWIPISPILDYCPQVELLRTLGVASTLISKTRKEVWHIRNSVSSESPCILPAFQTAWFSYILGNSLAWDCPLQWKRLFTTKYPNFWAVVESEQDALFQALHGSLKTMMIQRLMLLLFQKQGGLC